MGWIARYYRLMVMEEREVDSEQDAMVFLAEGERSGDISAEEIVSPTGEVVGRCREDTTWLSWDGIRHANTGTTRDASMDMVPVAMGIDTLSTR